MVIAQPKPELEQRRDAFLRGAQRDRVAGDHRPEGGLTTVFLVENEVNLLTVPRLERTFGLGALGGAVTLLRYLPWLVQTPIMYWGDLDVEGLAILSDLRALFPQTQSLLMDLACLEAWRHLAVPGKNQSPAVPPPPVRGRRRERAGCGPLGMVTRAEVEIVAKDRAILRQAGEQLGLQVIAGEGAALEVYETADPPAPHDAPNPGTRMIGFTITLQPGEAQRLTVVLQPGGVAEAIEDPGSFAT